MPPPPRVAVTRESLPDPLIPKGKSAPILKGKSVPMQPEGVILGSIVDPLTSSSKARSEIKIKLEDLHGVCILRVHYFSRSPY